MKTITIVFFALYLSTHLSAQNPFYDAMFLKDKINAENEKILLTHEVQEVLAKYLQVEPDSVKAVMFFNNPFLKNLFRDKGADAQDLGLLSEGMKSIGGLNVTSFADGLAKFLVARAKEELNVTFFRRFQEYIRRFPEVQVIFPKTYDILNQIFSYQYSAFLPALRASFYRDMNDFAANFIQLRELSIDSCHNDSDCESRFVTLDNFLNKKLVGRAFVASLLVVDNLIDGHNAADVLNEIDEDKICSDHIDNFSNCFHFANLFSNSIRSKEEGETWVNKGEINSLVLNSSAFRIYLGLIYATNEIRTIPINFSISDGDTFSLKKILIDASNSIQNLEHLKVKIKELGFLAGAVSTQAKTLTAEEGKGSDASILLYAEYASSVSKFLSQAVTFFNYKNEKLAGDISKFTATLDGAVDACYDIKSQNYTALLLHTSHILEVCLDTNYTFKDDYIKYGTFMANIIEADNSDEVKAAIEAAVLPVGSSSIKRETYSNISLNAFIGPTVAMEYLPGLTENETAPVIGITAPLGIAFNWGNHTNGKREDPSIVKMRNGREVGGKSYSLFFSFIDVGALTTFRFGDDSSDVASEIELANIVAPGVYFYWGLGKVPISIGLGAQMGPQLRDINAEVVNIDKNFYVKAGLSVVVDIPFFNFYTNNSRNIKNKKKG